MNINTKNTVKISYLYRPQNSRMTYKLRSEILHQIKYFFYFYGPYSQITLPLTLDKIKGKIQQKMHVAWLGPDWPSQGWALIGRARAGPWLAEPGPGPDWPSQGRALIGRALAGPWPGPGRALAGPWPSPGRALAEPWPSPGRALAEPWPSPGNLSLRPLF